METKMNCFTININGKTFLYQEIFKPESEDLVLIGQESMLDELMNKDRSKYNSEYARRIEERFYGFVEDEKFYEFDFNEFTEYVNSVLD
jgi:hypothetical protein